MRLLLIIFSLVPIIGFSQCGYQLVWADEFNGNALDLQNWSYQIGGGGWGNAELQSYTANNTNLQNGVLQIIAEEPSPNVYTSSRIRSIDKFDIKYGKLEASIKLPAGQGLWPAFWMMPSCSVYGGWPSSGEIDIMEYLGHDNDTSYGTCHFGNSPTDKGQLGTSYTLPIGDFTDGFHVFAVEWAENSIKWFVDGIQIYQVSDTDVTNYNWPFNEHFHFILNMAVGGNWPGPPNNQTSFPAIMEIDYVRAYQLTDDFEITGSKIAAPNSNNSMYSAPLFANAEYSWYTPSCANLVSGQGTNEIEIDWLTDGGEVTVVIELPCQTIQKSIQVELTNNQWTNPGIETGFKGWNNFFSNGAFGDVNLVSQAPYNGVQHVCIDVDGLGNNFWDVQFRHNTISVVSGQSYTLSFYAKADQNTRKLRIDFRDTNGNTSTDNVEYDLTTNWTFYQYVYTPTYNIPDLAVDFNQGFETGQFCYDELYFEISGPSTGTCATTSCVNDLNLQNVGIQNGTYKVIQTIDAQSIIYPTQLIDFQAGQCISLNPGFEAGLGSSFSATISACN